MDKIYGKKTKQMNIKLPIEQMHKFQTKCDDEGTNVSAKVRYFILRYLEGRLICKN